MSPAGFEQLKRGMRNTWMAGDFGQLARLTARYAEEFVERLPIRNGMQVLDIACGTGNLAMFRRDFEAIGPFAGIDVAEDMEWGQRARAAGFRPSCFRVRRPRASRD